MKLDLRVYEQPKDKRRKPKLIRGHVMEVAYSVPPRERTTPYQQDAGFQSPDHGMEGHMGYRCGECARSSPGACLGTPDGGDYWQNQQLKWQEQCDVLQNEYDHEVSAHYKVHVPTMLLAEGEVCNCPVPPDMPPKPSQPIERALVYRSFKR